MRVNRADTSMDDRMITSFRGVPFTGEVVDHAADGTVVELSSYQDGIEHGPQFEWYPDGTKQSEGQCDHGRAVGEWREWYPSGQLARYDQFNEFGDVLRTQRWDEAGELVEDYTAAPPRRTQA
ncbi:hypothetical protein ABT324_10825 [Saccharopolyspora sp. NPDC000359]|uniref:toxin-antitoxin system YwqK family antitoxin n=1 Tax=Saccharopolyspora sp. NPDC000359 TaxID=3154251 RepID=UPI003333F5D8